MPPLFTLIAAVSLAIMTIAAPSSIVGREAPPAASHGVSNEDYIQPNASASYNSSGSDTSRRFAAYWSM